MADGSIGYEAFLREKIRLAPLSGFECEPHKSSAADARAEAIQVVTVALRFLASIDRYEHAQCEQHRQGGEK